MSSTSSLTLSPPVVEATVVRSRRSKNNQSVKHSISTEVHDGNDDTEDIDDDVDDDNNRRRRRKQNDEEQSVAARGGGHSVTRSMQWLEEHDKQDPDAASPDMANFNKEEFRSASDAFKDPNAFDFLSQHGSERGACAGSGGAANLARESLYVKFDPLIAGRASILLAKDSLTDGQESHVSGKGCLRGNNDVPITGDNDDLIAMRSPSPIKMPGTIEYLSKEQTSSTKIIIAAEERLLFEEQLLKKDSRIAELEQIITENVVNNDNLRLEAKKRKESEEQMKQVLKEYEKTISELIAEKEKERSRFESEQQILLSDSGQATEDLKNVETAFADVHRKYERTKAVIEGFRSNEETLKGIIQENTIKLRKQDQKYDLLKAHAEEMLEKANIEIEHISRNQDAEIAKLTALMKKTEMKAASLERTIDQKVKENEELTAICDELIVKVGSGPGGGGI